MQTDESSLRLNLLRFPLIVGVIFIHNDSNQVAIAGGSIGMDSGTALTDSVRSLISQGFAGVAVPTFFLMSGYLFTANFTWSADNYVGKLQSRTHTLLIPFLFWNVATLGLIALAQSLPATALYFSGNSAPISSYAALDYINSIFGIGRFPISYQFWFIRDLMILVLLAPLILVLNKYVGRYFLAVLFACWFLGLWPIGAPSIEGTLFFSLGCYLSTNRKSLFALDAYGKTIAATYVVLALGDAALPLSAASLYLHKTALVFGIITALYLTKAAAKIDSVRNTLLHLAGVSFFLFAAHEPLLTIVRKITYRILQPNSVYSLLGCYLFIPILVIGIVLVLHRALKVAAPGFTRVISGGR